ncbi:MULTISPECIES: DUF6527 family protein [Paraburkholderia]|uniref:DUF6527 family protein n=1 Tax=Paraburkholderia TaxID=1822464 RepID=UPI00349E6BEE
MYAVGECGQFWLAALMCPCGCGDTIQLPVIEGQRPPTLDPHAEKHPPSEPLSVCRPHGRLPLHSG